MTPARLARWALTLLLIGLAAWYVRGNESALEQLRREVRADCAYKRDVTGVPARLPESTGPVTLTLAWDAHDAYLAKGCVDELGPLAPPPLPRPPVERE